MPAVWLALGAVDALALWLADEEEGEEEEEDGEGAVLAVSLVGAEGVALGGAGDAAGLGIGAGTGVATGAGALAGLGLAAMALGAGVGAGIGDGAWIWLDSPAACACSAALDVSSIEKKPALPSAVEDAVLVPDISAVRVLVFRAVLVSESTLISAFQNASLCSEQIPGHFRPRGSPGPAPPTAGPPAILAYQGGT